MNILLLAYYFLTMFVLICFRLSSGPVLDQKQENLFAEGFGIGAAFNTCGQSFTAGFDQVLRYLDVGFRPHDVAGGITLTMVVCL